MTKTKKRATKIKKHYQIWSCPDTLLPDEPPELVCECDNLADIINYCRHYFAVEMYYNCLFFKEKNACDWQAAIGREKYGDKAILIWDDNGQIDRFVDYLTFEKHWPIKPLTKLN